MNEPAAITATFSDFRLVKTRKLAQLVFEVPIEEADRALAALGGLPRSDMERWCGIARLNSAAPPTADAGTDGNLHHQPLPTSTAPSEAVADGAPWTDAECEEFAAIVAGKATKPRRHFSELPRAQQAGILCNDARFRQWVGAEEGWANPAEVEVEDAAQYIRQTCGIVSRSALDISPRTKAAFDALYYRYMQETGQAAEPRR